MPTPEYKEILINVAKAIEARADKIAYSAIFTRQEAGDMIVTGTPLGAGARLDPPKIVVPGEAIEIEAAGTGILRKTVQDEFQESPA